LGEDIISKNEDIVVFNQNIKSCEMPLKELENVDHKCPVCQSDISSYKKKELTKEYKAKIVENEKLISENEEAVSSLSENKSSL
jgi:exonuclease SbcC